MTNPIFIGVDIGGTSLRAARFDGHTHIPVGKAKSPTYAAKGHEAVIQRLEKIIREVAPPDLAGVAGVGVIAPGPLDPFVGAVLSAPNLPGWENLPLAAELRRRTGLATVIENDANAAALAEWRWGAGRGFEDLVYLTMSTGVGGGLVLGGRLYAGRRGNAGEVGHLPVEWDGEPCACGMRGCLEAYVGGAAWTRRLRRIAPARGRVAELAGGRERATPRHVVAAAREGDDFARGEMERWNHYLARGLVALVFALAPQAVVLGTIATAAGEELCFSPLRELVVSRVWPLLGRELAILPSGLGDALPDRAGVAVAFQELAAG